MLNFCRGVKSWHTWDSARRNTSHKILEYLVLVRANILVEKYVLVTNLCSLHWKGAKEAGGRRERNGQGGACGLELGVRWVWAWAWRTVTASWADARVTVAWEERAAWEMGKGEREEERVVAERGGTGLGFHLWFPSLLCLSIFNSSDHEQRLFYKLNLHRRCD